MWATILAWTAGALLLAPGAMSYLALAPAAALLWVVSEDGESAIRNAIPGFLSGVAVSALSIALAREADSVPVTILILLLLVVAVVKSITVVRERREKE